MVANHKALQAERKDAQAKTQEEKNMAQVARNNLMQRHSQKRRLGDPSTIGIDDENSVASERASKKPKSEKLQLLERMTQAVESYGEGGRTGKGEGRGEEEERLSKVERELGQIRADNDEMKGEFARLRISRNEQNALLRELLALQRKQT